MICRPQPVVYGFILALLGASGCTLFTSPDEAGDETSDPDVIYFNSFESNADTAGWYGNGTFRFSDDVPGEGGTRSAFISGACLIPHSAFDFTTANDALLVLKATGKNLEIGGSVVLERADEDEPARVRTAIGIQVSEPEWTTYQSDDTLQVHAGDRLRLSFGAGGFVASAMLVDLVEITRVD